MKKIQIIFFATILFSSIISCKKQLEVKNPNQPIPESAITEAGTIALAQGGIYRNGFRDLKYSDGVYGFFWSGAIGFHEMMGDAIQVEAANAFINQIGCPDKVTLDNGTVVLNPNSPNTQKALVRNVVNFNSNQGQNTLYYEWAYMYSMINACNTILYTVEKTSFLSEAATKKATIQAWAYWWKGFAYARIGSIYYAGVINNSDGAIVNNTAGKTNANYVTKEAIISESNRVLDLATAALNTVTTVTAYNEVLGKLIPSFCQVGKGGILTTDMWKRNINTLKARNILVNTPVATMTADQWTSILTLTNDGVLATDKVFTGRSNTAGDFLSATSGTVASKVQSALAGGNTYKLSERLVQDFKPGDKRLANNVAQTVTWIGNGDRGHVFNTRYRLINKGTGLAGVKVYTNTDAGGEETFLAGSFEENELMKAEALIYTGSIDAGLALIDAVRNSQGAGLSAVSGTGLTLTEAKEELRRERRVALPFIGLSFYDARRWGIINPVSEGGGRTGAVVITGSGAVNTNATIEYNFLDYWDVPDNELVYNPPSAGSAPVKNPK
ncbi:RagB/SusD family nutrient uptake outer membrane protein [Terrimonas pollutisoli]|uniref:RagB/SusD family nutrient uptake outer membrane protein n=1 Tax=Terrimonas pollutisoli TaxID=3034147 RepID=UPI0023EAD630|nr:RagB/SusD family nutrient uptake outer membrane protein [Terrimonas sp. H1YJ31]